MSSLLKSFLFLLLSIPQFAVADIASGKKLFDEANCMSCHATKPFNPEKTQSFQSLKKRVAFCSNNFNAGWFDEDIQQVAAYLNNTYYHFPSDLN